MRKREFVGVGAVIGVFCTIIGFAAYRKGSRNGFMEGYKDADKLNNTKLCEYSAFLTAFPAADWHLNVLVCPQRNMMPLKLINMP